ncbi:stage V sporulation protein D (sporulation-specific penicillin-binding protein) [Melghiribacillus thermohalophilus]|uniref:serine-type D-Ala-D-Ala carboxypeptidase n=1 Tax=Melghiribacillus thermohalophilus TaxID=1324956 RepID=A0A4R3NBQ3_9BACI|nr:stage V sporulation protein D [Melghiribacillus thermohalophilus]TCT26874.1 stage V sporulation protein D (sporulation-specific penicillin-binding protein) [Melghiribacillus thermohalophilus]
MKRVSHVTVRKRLVTVFLFGLALFLVMSIRLGYVQFILGDELYQKAEELWQRDITLEPERGKILDRNGKILVDNVSAPSVNVVPRQVENPQKTAEALANILNMSYDKAYDYVTKVAAVVRIHPEGRKLSENQVLQIQELNMPGVYIAEDSKRNYPYDDMLAHILGFTGIDNQGLAGIELFYDDKLNGKQGSLSFFSDAKGKKLTDHAEIYKPPEDGMDLKLTIDVNVQKIIERELDLAEDKYNPDGALAIALDPDTGEVLGMDSRPKFHPSNYQEAKPEVYNRNLPVWSTYEPGSTFKIITLAAALEEGKVDLEEDHFHDPGYIEVEGATLHCWRRGGHGSQTYLEVVQNSCNPGFVSLGEKLGKKKLFSYIEKFGFGQKTGIDLQGEGKGILFKEENVGPVELATTSFGQGVSVTPIQQVMAVAAAVNGGYLYQPYIASEWLHPVTGEVVSQKEPVLKERVISAETSEKIRKALESVVAQGTGRGAYVEGYRVGGKTGTAQKVGPDGQYMSDNHIVSFIGFAPADDPELVVYVAIDNPKNTVQFGGVVAAPIVGNIMSDSLRSLGVKERTEGLEKEYQWPDEPLIEVPDLVGLNKDELSKYLLNLSVDQDGQGNYVIDQSPEPGKKVEQGSTIRILLGEKN